MSNSNARTLESMSPLSAGVPGTPDAATKNVVAQNAPTTPVSKPKIAAEAPGAPTKKRASAWKFTDVRVVVKADSSVASIEVLSLGGPLNVRFESEKGDDTPLLPFARIPNAALFSNPNCGTDAFFNVTALMQALDRVVAATGMQDALGAPSEWTKLVKRRAGYQAEFHPIVFELRCNRSTKKTSRCRLIVMRITDVTKGATAFTMRECERKTSRRTAVETCAAGECTTSGPRIKKRAPKRRAAEVEAVMGLDKLKRLKSDEEAAA